MGICNGLVKTFNKVVNKYDTKRLSKQSAPEGVKVYADIPYLEDGNEYHYLDIYLPENAAGKLPVLFDIHGGSWIYGKKDINKYYAMNLAKFGFAVVNISYRLLQYDGTFPNNIQDIFAAFNFINDNKEKYPFDMNNVFLTGDSAGAHLASIVTAISTDEEFAKSLNIKVPFKFNAVGLTCGVFDLERIRKKVKLSIIRHLHKLFIGNDYKTNPMRLRMTTKNNKIENFPPVFLSTGEQDFVRRESIRFYEVLKEKGIECELVDYKRKDSTESLIHVYNVLYPLRDESVKTNTMMCDFFKGYIKA